MTARCHEDSCSIEWSEVTTLSGPAFHADVTLDPVRGLACVVDEGVGVKLVNDVVLEALCRNILRRNAVGALHASIPDAVIEDFEDAARTAIPADRDTTAGDYAVTATTHTYDNDSACDQLVFVTGELFYKYAVLGEGSAVVDAGNLLRITDFATSGASGACVSGQVVPFNAQVNAIVQFALNAAPSLTLARHQFNVSGNMVTFSGAQEYQYGANRGSFVGAVVVPAGQQLRINSAWAYEGKDQTVNVIAYGGTVFSTLGAHIKNGQFIALPMGG